jgi:hypothetical protein
MSIVGMVCQSSLRVLLNSFAILLGCVPNGQQLCLPAAQQVLWYCCNVHVAKRLAAAELTAG